MNIWDANKIMKSSKLFTLFSIITIIFNLVFNNLRIVIKWFFRFFLIILFVDLIIKNMQTSTLNVFGLINLQGPLILLLCCSFILGSILGITKRVLSNLKLKSKLYQLEKLNARLNSSLEKYNKKYTNNKDDASDEFVNTKSNDDNVTDNATINK